MPESIKIDYDDNPEDIIDKIDKALNVHGLQLKYDDKEHDGFVILNLIAKTHVKENEDFLDELVRERTAKNPDFPRLVEEAAEHWTERVQWCLGQTASCLGYMLERIHEGNLGQGSENNHGAAWISEYILRYLHAAEYWSMHKEPECQHKWSGAGEGYYENYQWCIQCGALACNNDITFPNKDATEIKWL